MGSRARCFGAASCTVEKIGLTTRSGTSSGPYLEASELGLGALAAEAVMKLAEIAGVRGQAGAAEAYALAAFGEFAGHRPERTAEVLRVQGVALGGARGLSLLARAVELREDQLEIHPGSPELLSRAQESYARGLLDAGRPDEGLEQLEMALATHRDEFGHGTWRTPELLRGKLGGLWGAGEVDRRGEDRISDSSVSMTRTRIWNIFTKDTLWVASVCDERGNRRLAIEVLIASRDRLAEFGQLDAAAQVKRVLGELGVTTEHVRPAATPD